MDINDAAFYHSPGLKRHARHVIHFLDRVMVLLAMSLPCSPEVDSISNPITYKPGEVQDVLRGILLDLGQKHQALGVTARMYQPMGQALLATVAELLQEVCHEKFTSVCVQAWIAVYHALASDLIDAGTNL